MIGTLKKIFGIGPKVDLAELVKQGGVIVDVRTKGEYAGGSIKNSINIPLDQLSKNLSKFKDKNAPIITCCASGMRSGRATRILRKHGLEAYNGGAWQHVNQTMNHD